MSLNSFTKAPQVFGLFVFLVTNAYSQTPVYTAQDTTMSAASYSLFQFTPFIPGSTVSDTLTFNATGGSTDGGSYLTFTNTFTSSTSGFIGGINYWLHDTLSYDPSGDPSGSTYRLDGNFDRLQTDGSSSGGSDFIFAEQNGNITSLGSFGGFYDPWLNASDSKETNLDPSDGLIRFGFAKTSLSGPTGSPQNLIETSGIDNLSLTLVRTTPVPEPTTALLGLASLGMLLVRHRA